MTGRTWQTPTDWNELAYRNRTPVAAAIASVIATVSGYPLDSIKSRLQVKRYASVLDCARDIWRTEGVKGYYRGVAMPLVTITIVRTASFTIYNTVKEELHKRGHFDRPIVPHKAVSGLLGGATAGVMISVGSCTFELIKVRAQLESIIAAKQNRPFRELTTLQGARDIWKNHGPRGFYFGFRLHCLRDTFGTAIYFAFIPKPLIPFACGSVCGLTSWLLIYPLDALKTRVQRDALASMPNRSTLTIFRSLTANGFGRLYSGLGVSATRSLIQHGLLWSFVESIRRRIEIATGHQDAPPLEV